MFATGRVITKLGAIKFPTNIFVEQQRTPHFEMDKALELFETRPLVNSGIRQLARFICGEEIKCKSVDRQTSEFVNNWIKLRPGLDNEVFNLVISTLVTGNGFMEMSWKEMTNKSLLLDNVYNINDVSRVYLNIDYEGLDDEYWLYEVPIEVRTFPFMGEVKSPQFFRVNYVYGSYIFSKMVWAIPIHKNKIRHARIGWSRDSLYGRSFLSSAIDNGEVMKEILKNFSVIARYRALGRKIISIGTPTDPASPEDMDKLESDLRDIRDKDHIIINKEIKSEPLSYTGENDPMEPQMEFLRKDMASGLLPNYLTPWGSAETNRATAQESKIPFQLEIKAIQADIEQFLTDVIIGELRKSYSWISPDATIYLGHIDLETIEDKMAYAPTLYQNNIITLNELRSLIGYDKIQNGDKFLKDIVPVETIQPETIQINDKTNTIPECFKEQLNNEDEKFIRELGIKNKINLKVIKKKDINGRKIRLVGYDGGYLIFDGNELLKEFLKDERRVADVYFDTIVEKREKALDEFYDFELPEHKIEEDLFENIKRLNAEVIDELFEEIPKNKVHVEKWLKEQTTIGKDMLPKTDVIFDAFERKIGDVIDGAISKVLGNIIKPEVRLGLDPDADEATARTLRDRADIIRQRMKQQAKSFNDKARTDVIRTLSDGIAVNKSLRDIKQEIKDNYMNYKVKEAPQDWQIDRITRTEMGNATILLKLIKWKEMGFKKAERLVHIDEKTCEICRPLNRRVDDIDYLLEREDRRLKHPSCRCSFVAYS